MNLPIQWRVNPGPYAGYQMLHATVVVDRERYTKQMAMPASFSKATWWLAVAAMTAEINNVVKSPPAQ